MTTLADVLIVTVAGCFAGQLPRVPCEPPEPPPAEESVLHFSARQMVIPPEGTTVISWYAPGQACESSWGGVEPDRGHAEVGSGVYTLTCDGRSKSLEVKTLGHIDFTDRADDWYGYQLDETDLAVYSFIQPPEGRQLRVPSEYATIRDAAVALNAMSPAFEYAWSAIILEGGEHDCYPAEIRSPYVVIRGEPEAVCTSHLRLGVDADHILVQNVEFRDAKIMSASSLAERRGACHTTLENVYVHGSLDYPIIPPHCWANFRDETSYLRTFNSTLGPVKHHNTYCQAVGLCLSVNSTYLGQVATEVGYAHNYHSIGLRNYLVGNTFDGERTLGGWGVDIAGCSKSIVRDNHIILRETSGKGAIGLTGQRPGVFVQPDVDPARCTMYAFGGGGRDEDNYRCSDNPGWADVVVEGNTITNERPPFDSTSSDSSFAVSAAQSSQAYRVRWCYGPDGERVTDPNNDWYWCTCSIAGDHPRSTWGTWRDNTLINVPRECVGCEWLK